MNGYNFFHFWTHFIDSPWKRSILISHNQYLNWNFKMSSQNGSPEPKVSLYNFFHFRPHFIDSPWKRSILICHNQYLIWNLKMSTQNGSPELKVSSCNFFHFWPYYIDCPWKRSILILKRWGRNRYFSLTCTLYKPVIFTNQHCFTNQ